MIARRSVTKIANTTTMIAAALVTVPAVRVIPRATAACESAPWSKASLMRERMNTS